MASRNSGIASVNELFAMKKNLAYEAKFTHRLDAMTKDYFHTKENLKREIRSVYNELQDMKSSTGYTLDQVRSAHPTNSPYRNPNIPKIYLPPIGVRLVKKYVGVDVKRQSLTDVNKGVGKRRSLGDVLNCAFGLDKSDKFDRIGNKEQTSHQESYVVKELDRHHFRAEHIGVIEAVPATNETHLEEFGDDGNIVDVERTDEASLKARISDTDVSSGNSSSNQTMSEAPDILTRSMLPFTITREQPLDEITFGRKDEAIMIEKDTLEPASTEGKYEKLEISMEDNLEISYNLKERRSSRSTFRTRNSARLPSRSSHLSEHNLDVAGISRQSNNKKTRRSATKEKNQYFYLDYGDGKLHDIMEIPRTKDCSRPWCNPHCKTCVNRATSRPCFILIPADDNIRKRKIPQDKRRLSMFPVYKSSESAAEKVPESNKEIVDVKTEQETKPSTEDALKDTTSEYIRVDNSSLAEDIIKSVETKTITQCMDLVGGDEGNKVLDVEKENASEDRLKLPIKPARKKGFSQKRINELALPRGGPPAEVRFSKTSLRRTQEQMIEHERTKALTEYERGNLTYIQGKISVFLALMNEQELSAIDSRPAEMCTAERECDMNISTSKLSTKNRRKSVRFSPRPRYRLLS